MTGHVEQTEDAPSFLVRTPPCINTEFFILWTDTSKKKATEVSLCVCGHMQRQI